jgi:endoglucanase
VTGYGTVYPDSTHHRPSQVLGVTLKGMLVGGADSNLEDSYAKAVLYGRPIERCYVDNAQSYSCNEVTIYWNSPLIYLLASFK